MKTNQSTKVACEKTANVLESKLTKISLILIDHNIFLSRVKLFPFRKFIGFDSSLSDKFVKTL